MKVAFIDKRKDVKVFDFKNQTAESFNRFVELTGKDTIYNMISEKSNNTFTPVKHIVDPDSSDEIYRCKYCGEYTVGKDDDVLCFGCRCTFGHTYYSEL